jgi:hypothetical protein
MHRTLVVYALKQFGINFMSHVNRQTPEKPTATERIAALTKANL